MRHPSFLEQVANAWHATQETERPGLLITPNDRSRRLLLQALGQTYSGKALWAPAILTWPQWVGELTDRTLADPLTLKLELFDVYRQVYGASETFEVFLNWADVILSDFDLLEHSVVPHRQVFSLLHDHATVLPDAFADYEAVHQFILALGGSEKRAAVTQRFLNDWQKLGELYFLFQDRLATRNWAYPSLALRLACETWEQTPPENLPANGIWLIGFYQLSRLQRRLVHLLNKSMPVVCWLEQPTAWWQESQNPVGEGLKDFTGLTVRYADSPTPSQAKLQLWACPHLTAQVRAVGNHLADSETAVSELGSPDMLDDDTPNWEDETPADTTTEKTRIAVVLLGPELLFAQLNALPPKIRSINTSLGQQIRHTHQYQLLELVQQLQRRSQAANRLMPVQEWIQVLRFLPMLGSEYAEFLTIATQLIRTGRLYLTPEEALADLPQTLPASGLELIRLISTGIFRLPEESPQQAFFRLLDQLFKELYKGQAGLTVSGDILESNIYFLLSQQAERLKHALEEYQLNQLSLNDLWRTFKNLVRQHALAFTNESRSGLQIIQLHDTLCLDFDIVYLVGANEENLQGFSTANSLIPVALKRGLGLPVPETELVRKQYLTLRLFNRAQSVYVTYLNPELVPESRPLAPIFRQIQENLTPGAITHRELNFDTGVYTSVPSPFAIPKTPDILTRLRKWQIDSSSDTRPSDQTVYLSYSTLHTYLKCPLEFYLTYVLQAGNTLESTEEIDHIAFGALVHLTLELLYTDLLGKHPGQYCQKQSEERIKKLLEQTANKAFRIQYQLPERGITVVGRQRLVLELVKKYAQTVIEHDKETVAQEHILLEIEQDWHTSFKITEDLTVRMGGKVDRLEKRNNQPTILDYKTGKVEAKFPNQIEKLKAPEKKIEWLFDRNNASSQKSRNLFQAYLYGWLAYQCKQEIQDPQFEFFSTRVQGKSQTVELDILDSTARQLYEQNLKLLVTEIFNPDIPFTQTPDPKACTYCTHKLVCQR
jgi:RecB family exonuclease